MDKLSAKQQFTCDVLEMLLDLGVPRDKWAMVLRDLVDVIERPLVKRANPAAAAVAGPTIMSKVSPIAKYLWDAGPNRVYDAAWDVAKSLTPWAVGSALLAPPIASYWAGRSIPAITDINPREVVEDVHNEEELRTLEHSIARLRASRAAGRR